MKLIRYDQPHFHKHIARACAASSILDAEVERRTRNVIEAVRQRGDNALIEFAARFDRVKLSRPQIRLTAPPSPIDAGIRKAIAAAHRNVAAFARQSLRKNWTMLNSQGGRVGEKFDPIQRVGIYIPGGTAPLVSTALMTITLAKVAGCPEIVACSPSSDPALHYAMRLAGATEIYRVGGAQAVAAMALGTRTIRRVNKIYGPGNAYVTAAKRLLFGVVGIDMLSGPSELLVLADDSADPRFIAADLIAQAEHGSGYERVWLVTTSKRILREVPQASWELVAGVSRAGFIHRAIERNAVLVLAKDLDQAAVIANQMAPEHCELMTRQNARILRQLITAGAIFIGPWSPTAVGDYLAGPSHALPTGGAGAWFAGLTVDQFQRRTSIIEMNRASLKKSLPALSALGTVEGLDAHVQSARVRFA